MDCNSLAFFVSGNRIRNRTMLEVLTQQIARAAYLRQFYDVDPEDFWLLEKEPTTLEGKEAEEALLNFGKGL